MIKQAQSGFSTVELMISLFIAVAFLASGYQLYSVIMKDGATTRYQAQASNIAYAAMRKYTTQPSGNCISTTTPSPAPVLSPEDTKLLPALPSGAPQLIIAFSCPYGADSNIWRITATVRYGNPQKEVSHATFTAA